VTIGRWSMGSSTGTGLGLPGVTCLRTQGDQTAHRRRRRLPEPSRATAPRRRRADRSPRRVASQRPPPPVRRLHRPAPTQANTEEVAQPALTASSSNGRTPRRATPRGGTSPAVAAAGGGPGGLSSRTPDAHRGSWRPSSALMIFRVGWLARILSASPPEHAVGGAVRRFSVTPPARYAIQQRAGVSRRVYRPLGTGSLSGDSSFLIDMQAPTPHRGSRWVWCLISSAPVPLDLLGQQPGQVVHCQRLVLVLVRRGAMPRPPCVDLPARHVPLERGQLHPPLPSRRS
jgi:hypothetical protein